MKTKTPGSRFGSSYDDYKVSVPEGTSGSITVKRFVVTEKDSRADAMRSIFSGSARFVDPGTYTGMYEGGVLWMSDTRDEIHDHSGAIIEATGRVLIHGLGIGMVVQACLRKGDAYTWELPKGSRWDVAWHDIWPSITSGNLEGIARLKRRFGKRVDWQGAWCEETIRHNERRARTSEWY